MNRVRIVVVVPELSDEEAIDLKKALEALLKEHPGATVELTMRPVQRRR